ncbi:MAG: O-antigen ligase family protein [Chloroflexi bacterium]|nr:O-antigen ligase family protein [Chloroflexota bacterium]
MVEPGGSSGAAAEPGDRLDFLMGAVLVIACVLVIQALGTYAFSVSARVRIAGTVVTLGMLLLWGAVMILRPTYRPRTVLAGPIVAATLAFGAAVLASQRPRLSLEPALIGVAAALTLLMLTALLRITTIRRLVGSMVMLIPVVISVVYVAAVFAEWVRWWTLVGRLTAPPLRPSFVDLSLGSPNLVATYLILFAPLGAASAARRFGTRAAVASLLLAGLALFLTGSRSGYLAAAVVALLAVIVTFASLGPATREYMSRTGRRGIGLAAAAGLVVAVLGFVAAPGLLARLSFAGADYRSWFWRSAFELFQGSPLVGTGPGTWAQLKLATVLPTEINAVVPHAHSLVFQTLAEVGLLGAAGLVVLAAAVALRARAVHRAGDQWVRLEVVAASSGLVGLLVQQGTDYLMNLPAVTLSAALLIAWIDGSVARPPRPEGRIARRSAWLAVPATLVLGAVMAAAAPTMLRIGDAMLQANGASEAAASGNWSAALDGYDRAVAGDPDFTLYQIQRGNALAHLGRVEEARAAYASVIDTDLLPGNVIALATLEMETGNFSRSADLARLALRRGQRDPLITLNAGRILEAAGDIQAATTAYAAAIRGDFALAASAYWRAPERVVPLNRVVAEARAERLAAGDLASAAIISAFAGRIEEARADVATLVDPDSRRFIGALIEGLAGDRAAAIAELTRRVKADPSDFQALVWLVQVLVVNGDPDAGRYADQARILRRDEANGAMRVMSVVPATDAERSQEPGSGYPFAVYARLGPPDPWPPQVLVIGSAGPS